MRIFSRLKETLFFIVLSARTTGKQRTEKSAQHFNIKLKCVI